LWFNERMNTTATTISPILVDVEVPTVDRPRNESDDVVARLNEMVGAPLFRAASGRTVLMSTTTAEILANLLSHAK
jgi:hypothetical protein